MYQHDLEEVNFLEQNTKLNVRGFIVRMRRRLSYLKEQIEFIVSKTES